MAVSIASKVEVNGTQLYCVRCGNGSHPVLLIPGAVGHTDYVFAPLFQYFGREGSGYTAVSYDLRGYGKSRPPKRSFNLVPEHYHETDAYDGYQLMTSLGFREFSVLGWCAGGVSAVFLAARFPAAVKNVAVWGTQAFLTERDLESFESTRDIKDWNPHLRAAVEEIYGFEELSRLWSEEIDTRRAFLSIRPDGDLCVGELPQVKCPVLILHGGKDILCAQSHAEFLRDHIPRSRLHLIADGKHQLHMTSSVEFTEVIDEFLQDQK